jgi:hypothetical protein
VRVIPRIVNRNPSLFAKSANLNSAFDVGIKPLDRSKMTLELKQSSLEIAFLTRRDFKDESKK